ncbi:MAG: phosphatidylglycerophosphatase A [Pseudomonadales bacterium]
MSGLSWRQWRDPEVLVCCGFGSGFLPRAPGTWGSLAALGVWWWLLAPLPWWLQLISALMVFGSGVWLVNRVARRYAVGDEPAIVIDEFAGLWIALVGQGADAVPVVIGFTAFRVFDILKPWPIGLADARVKGGFGVMLDDLLAGLLALFVLQISFRWIAGGI